LAEASIAQKLNNNKKGKTDEKTSLHCIGGKWLAFRSSAAF
jgi:hypothetical protein